MNVVPLGSQAGSVALVALAGRAVPGVREDWAGAIAVRVRATAAPVESGRVAGVGTGGHVRTVTAAVR